MNARIVSGAVAIMTPVLFAALGGLFTENAGVLNIALEGLLLIAAFSANTAAFFSGSALQGLAAGILSSVLLSALLGFFILKLKSNVYIAGLAANLFSQGMTIILSQRIFSTRGAVAARNLAPLAVAKLSFLENIPLIGEIFSGHTFFVYASWIMVFFAWIFLYRTPAGFHLRAAGSRAEALESLGLRPDRLRFAAYLLSGFCCGIGGSLLSLGLGVFVPNMSSGRGWIALVVIYLAGKKPQGLIPAALIFGLAESFSNYAQGAFNAPADFLLALPYLFTLAGMIAVSAASERKNRVI